MAVAGQQRRSGLGRQKLHPPAHLIGIWAHLIRVPLQRDVLGNGELAVGDAGRLGDAARLVTGANFHVLVGEAALEAEDDMAACFREGVQTRKLGIRSGIERGNDDELVGGKVGRRGIDEIDLRIHPVERIVERPDDVVVALVGIVLEFELVEGRLRIVADVDGDVVALAQVHELRAKALEVCADRRGFEKGRVWLVVLAQQAAPIGLEGIGRASPVPVLEHVGAVGEMAEGLQAQLTRVGRPLRITLRLGFDEQEILPALERTRHVAAEGDLGARQFVLRRMIDVDTGDVERMRRVKMVHARLHAVGVAAPIEIEILRDELTRPVVTPYKVDLPGKVIRDEAALKRRESGIDARIDRAVCGREVFPVVDTVAPVIEPELVIELVEVGEARTDPADEGRLHVRPTRVVIFSLVVNLIAYYRRVVLHVLDEGDDDPLRRLPKNWVGDVHILALAVKVLALRRDREHVRMLSREPGRDRVGRRANDYLDAGLVHRVKDAVDVGEVEDALLRFFRAPGRFCNAHDGDARLLHHAHVLVETVVGRIFVVIGRTKRMVGKAGGPAASEGCDASASLAARMVDRVMDRARTGRRFIRTYPLQARPVGRRRSWNEVTEWQE